MVGEREMNIITIRELKTGYTVTDDNGQYAAETKESVTRLIRKSLGISEPEHDQEWTIEPVQITEPEKIKETLHPVPNILKQDILIPRFKYNDSLKNSILDYKNTWYAELPDGRVVLGYGGSSYYTTKENVMKIPFPVPYGYFKGSGVSTTTLTCLRAYRSLLSADKILGKNDDDIGWKDESGSIAFREHEKKIKEQTDTQKGNEDGTCDDITFDSCANNSPENCKHCMNESRFEDKKKLAAKKPAPPLMKATVDP
uniref:Uncharacterized protein n=2 Tax=viral metagenome TaxID=1070528 RepID=A0A6M3KYP5_9ZZZZ